MEDYSRNKNQVDNYYNQNWILHEDNASSDNENQYSDNEQSEEIYSEDDFESNHSSDNEIDDMNSKLQYLYSSNKINYQDIYNSYYPFASPESANIYKMSYFEKMYKHCPACFNKIKNDDNIFILDRYIILCDKCFHGKFKIY